ncbi:hypothetical protein ACFFGN_35980, partial [Kribbella deserti]
MTRVGKMIATVAAGAVAVGGLVMVPSAQGAGSVRSSVSLAAPASGVYGSTIKLTGTVWRTGTTTKLPGATVYLQRSVRGQNRYGNLTSTRTTSTGTFAFSVTQVSAYDYRAYYPGSATYTRAYSPVRYPVTNRYLAIESMSTTDADLGKLRAIGKSVPSLPDGSMVYLQRYSTDTRAWTTVAGGKSTAGRATIDATRPGSNDTYRLVTGSYWPYGPGTSTARQFAHYVW